MKRALFLALVIWAGACSGDQRDACVDNDDCFASEVCLPQGFCGNPPGVETDAGGSDAAPADDADHATGDDVSTPDGGTSNDDASQEDADAGTDDLIHFDVEGIGTSCADPDPDDDQTIRCETLADGSQRISILWPGQSNPVVGGIRFSIQTPDRMDVQFDYDLHLILREP